MKLHRFKYLLKNGKNPKYKYYINAYTKTYFPHVLLRPWLDGKLKDLDKRDDKDYILSRVAYYNKLATDCAIDQETWKKAALPVRSQKRTHPSVYFLDTMEYARWFPKHLKYAMLPGDITEVPEIPMIVKSRPIEGDNRNSVVMKLDKVRHFVFLNDHVEFEEKKDMAIFRGGIKSNKNRWEFLEKYFSHPKVDAASTDDARPEWKGRLLTLRDHLQYKFILSLEGNDVASNLKWIMSSNSVAVMPRPTYETWFMEGTLIPDYHYIEIKPDFSDLIEKMDYYIAHPDEAKAIIRHANEYVAQFKDKKREDLISLLVLDKYFRITNK